VGGSQASRNGGISAFQQFARSSFCRVHEGSPIPAILWLSGVPISTLYLTCQPLFRRSPNKNAEF
jgi:hypothetical protein